MDKKTKAILIIIIILAIFLLFLMTKSQKQKSWVVGTNFSNPVIANESNIPDCKKLPVEYQMGCFIDLAAKTGNISICESEISEKELIYTSDWKGSCYTNVAIRTGDYSLCELVKTNELNSPDDCYMNIMFETKDKNICRKIKDNSTRDYCFSYKMLSER